MLSHRCWFLPNLRWVIGSGTRVSALNDNWIPEIGPHWNIPLKDGVQRLDLPNLVCDLFIKDQPNNFLARDREKIQRQGGYNSINY